MAPASLETSSQIYLRWATQADIPSITKVLHANLLNFEFHDHFCPRRTERPAEFYEFVRSRVRAVFLKPTVRFMVAENLELDLSGQKAQIVGFAGWDGQGDKNPIGSKWAAESRGLPNALEQWLVWAESIYHRYTRNTIFDYDGFTTVLGRLRDSYGNDERLKSNLHLQFLMVDPAWQRGYGVGHRLLKWGLDVADQTGIPVVLESSLAGYPFYLKHGFKLFKKVRIDLDPTKAYDMPVLVYEPKEEKGLYI